jgi:hypothetical protein
VQFSSTFNGFWFPFAVKVAAFLVFFKVGLPIPQTGYFRDPRRNSFARQIPHNPQDRQDSYRR